MALLVILLLPLQIAPPPRVDRVAWMQGCWSLQDGDRVIEEQWLSPRGSTMLGVGRTTRADRLIAYEFIVIRERGTQLSYESNPGDQEPTVFMSTTIGDRSIVFENLKGDYPQRIGYERQSAVRLLGWTEGPQDGHTKRIESSYSRVACAGE